MKKNLNIAFFGSSILSAYWNGAATYYRGIVKSLYKAGHAVTFYEPDIYQRQQHKDIEVINYCKVEVYPNDKEKIREMLKHASSSDVIIKTSGIGTCDEFLEFEMLKLKKTTNLIIFWDVDAPATLDRVVANHSDPFTKCIPKFDLILTYGGGVSTPIFRQ